MQRRDFLKIIAQSVAFSGASSCVWAHEDSIPAWRILFDEGLVNSCTAALPSTVDIKEAIAGIWQDLDPHLVWDAHAHLIGIGDSGSGIYHTPDMDSFLHPVEKIRKWFYIHGACADNKTSGITVDQQVVNRLYQLMKAFPVGVKSLLFAFDASYNERGEPLKKQTAFYIPNQYAARIAQRYSDRFEWVASIHPYRVDALDALHEAVKKGARAVKWLPAAMGIDPAHPKCRAFYEVLAKYHLPLIAHAGLERAVHGMNQQENGNPLKLRVALEQGVRVVIAHCASLGTDLDLDAGKSAQMLPSFQLFTRMMNERRYEGHLFGDISAVTGANREPEVLRTILMSQEWHARLLNGSDYPLPAIPAFFSPQKWVKAGLLDEKHLSVLRLLRQANPLLFDLMMKRKLCWQGQSLLPTVFQTKRFFASV